MSWNTNKEKNKEQPRRRGLKGKKIYFIIIEIFLITLL
jgi:hypothetical protein